MAVTYEEVAAQASALSLEDRMRLATELLLRGPDRPQRSALEYLGVNGPLSEDVDARIRRGRDES